MHKKAVPSVLHKKYALLKRKVLVKMIIVLYYSATSAMKQNFLFHKYVV